MSKQLIIYTFNALVWGWQRLRLKIERTNAAPFHTQVNVLSFALNAPATTPFTRVLGRLVSSSSPEVYMALALDLSYLHNLAADTI
jgi:hypothetical protein